MTIWGLDIISKSVSVCKVLVILYSGVAGLPVWCIYLIVIINDICAMYGNHSSLIGG